MANQPIPTLPVAVTLDGTEQIEVVQPPGSGGTTKRATVGQIAGLVSAGSANFVVIGGAEGLVNARNLVVNGDLVFTDTGAAGTATIGPIATGAVTYAKFQSVPGLSVPGVAGTATGVVGALTGTAGQVLQVNLAGTGLGFASLAITTAAISGIVAVPSGGSGTGSLTPYGVLLGNGTSAVNVTVAPSAGQALIGQTSTSNPQWVTIGGDFTLSAAGAATIATAAVSYAKFQQVAGLSVVGVTGTATAVSGAITGAANQALIVNPGGTGLGFGQLNLSSTSAVTGQLATAFIANNAVTDAKLRQGAGLSVVGVTGTATANVADIVGVANQVFRITSGGTSAGFGSVNLAATTAVTGNLQIANFNSGSGASTGTFWRGDGTWVTPAGSGTLLSVTAGTGLAAGTITTTGTLSLQQLIPGGRLTCTAGTPVTSADAIGTTQAANIYYAPMNSPFVPINNGSSMALYQFTPTATDTTGLTLALGTAWAAASNFDYYITLNSSGTVVPCSSPAWASDTARSAGTATTNDYALFAGIPTNKNSMVMRLTQTATFTVAANQATLIGSFRTVAAGVTEDSYAKRFVYNAYNQCERPMRVNDSTVTWSYDAAAWRQARASTANQIDFLIGMQGPSVNAKAYSANINSLGSYQLAFVGIGVNSTATNINQFGGQINTGQTNTFFGYGQTEYNGFPGIGRSYIAWLEYGPGTGGTTTWLGTSAAALFNPGISGSIWA